MTEKAAKPKTARAKPKAVDEPQRMTLDYSLAELPSAQHRAGLAGLALMVEWLGRLPEEARKGTCRLLRMDQAGLTIEMDEAGLGSLLDATYAAAQEFAEYPSPWENKPPLKEVTREERDKRGKLKTKTFYVYPQIVPSGAWLADVEPNGDAHGPWIQLWRRMLWDVFRGKPASRLIFEKRANNEPTGLANKLWKDLIRPGNHSIELAGTFYLGAQAITADNVEFYDRARHQFLLHFWPFVAQVYVPTYVQPPEGKRQYLPYAIVVPDVGQLEWFCTVLKAALRERDSKLLGTSWPEGAVVDVAVEGALDVACRLRERLAAIAGRSEIEDLVLGFEVHHVNKDGNNVRVLFSGRFEPERETIIAYSQLRRTFWDSSFRRIWLTNLIQKKPPHAGLEKFIATSPFATMTIGSRTFRHDAKVFFDIAKAHEADMQQNDDESEDQELDEESKTSAAKPKDKSIEGIILDVVRGYVQRRMKSKYGLDWKEVKNTPKQQEYEQKREKLAKDAFLAVRSRPEGAFREYFAGTICSVPQFLDNERFRILTHELRNDPATVRTLTLLALSAAAYSSSKSKES